MGTAAVTAYCPGGREFLHDRPDAHCPAAPSFGLKAAEALVVERQRVLGVTDERGDEQQIEVAAVHGDGNIESVQLGGRVSSLKPLGSPQVMRHLDMEVDLDVAVTSRAPVRQHW